MGQRPCFPRPRTARPQESLARAGRAAALTRSISPKTYGLVGGQSSLAGPLGRRISGNSRFFRAWRLNWDTLGHWGRPHKFDIPKPVRKRQLCSPAPDTPQIDSRDRSPVHLLATQGWTTLRSAGFKICSIQPGGGDFLCTLGP